jgi:hypothetical protein
MTAAATLPQPDLFTFDVQLPENDAVPSLSSTAMLCSLSISAWSGYKYDREASDEIAELHAAEKDAGRYNKRLVPRDALKEITKALGEARRDHESLTLPWGDNGMRVLPGATYMDHTNLMKQREADFNGVVTRFVDGFESLVRTQKRLGTLLKVDDYPGMVDEAGTLRLAFPHQLRALFSFKTEVLPLSDANDFRVRLGDEDRERVKRRITESIQASLRIATRDLWQRLYKGVSHMATRMAEYNSAEDGKKPKLFDSMVSNIVDVVDVLPKLNIAGDTELDRMADDVRRSLLVDPKELRKSAAMRSDTAKAAAEITQRMAAYMGVPVSAVMSSASSSKPPRTA